VVVVMAGDSGGKALEDGRSPGQSISQSMHALAAESIQTKQRVSELGNKVREPQTSRRGTKEDAVAS
jgi:hypothetical protein